MSDKRCTSILKGAAVCNRPAVTRFFWPGREHAPNEVCQGCGEWAEKIADTLGFKLHTESMVTGQEGEGGPSRASLLEVDKP